MSSNPLEQNQFEELVANLSHENYRVRYKAARALGDIRDARAIEPLLEAIGDFDTKDEESKVNWSAGFALINIGEAAFDPLIKALARNIQHPNDDWRRYWVTQTLRFMGDKRAVEPLIQVLEDDDLSAILGAAQALGHLGDKQGIEPLIKTLVRLKYQREGGYVLTAISEAIQRLGGEINLKIIEQEVQALQRYEIPQKTKSNIYLHGPRGFSSIPTSREILEVLFRPYDIIGIEAKTTTYTTASKLFINEYRLLIHPENARPKHIEALGFDPAVILGTGVTFKWFYFEPDKGYSDSLKSHLEVALSDKFPMVVLIDISSPTKPPPGDNPRATERETTFEENLDLYRPPGKSEIEDFAKRYGLDDHNIITFDLTQPQSLTEAMIQAVRLFEGSKSD